jgi:hypothetical protein
VSARAASGRGFAGSATVRQTRFGTVLPVISIFSQTFLGLAGFAGLLVSVVAGGAAVAASSDAVDNVSESNKIIMRIRLLNDTTT